MKNTTFAIVTALLVGIITFCVAGTVKGQEPGQNAEPETYYREVEAELLDHTKTYLAEQGFANSGVTLNRIVDSDGSREYTFTIHHSRIDKMDEVERTGLAEQLSERKNVFPDTVEFANCTIHYDFLIL